MGCVDAERVVPRAFGQIAAVAAGGLPLELTHSVQSPSAPRAPAVRPAPFAGDGKAGAVAQEGKPTDPRVNL
jgi:hypothetical protein